MQTNRDFKIFPYLQIRFQFIIRAIQTKGNEEHFSYSEFFHILLVIWRTLMLTGPLVYLFITIRRVWYPPIPHGWN
jgi:hypothetical protein